MVICLLLGEYEGNKPSTLHEFLNYFVQVSASVDLLCNRDHLLRINTCLSCQQAAEDKLQMSWYFFSHEYVFGEQLVSPLPCSPCFSDTSTPCCLLPPHTLLVRKSWLLELTDRFTGPHCAALSSWLLSPCSPRPPICLHHKNPVGSPDLELSTPSQIFPICKSVYCCVHSFSMLLTGTPKKVSFARYLLTLTAVTRSYPAT